MLDDHRHAIRAERADAHHLSARDGAYGGAHGSANADAVPTNRRVARGLRFAERVDERAVHGPVQLTIIARSNGARAARVARRTAGFGSPALVLEYGDR